MKTVLCQSYRTHDVAPWVRRALESARAWADAQGWAYRFEDDALLERVPPWYHDRIGRRLPVITDLGRLLWMRELLNEGYDRAIWIDADVVVFDPQGFRLTMEEDDLFGSEVWIQPSAAGVLQARRNVHNAILAFNKNTVFLDFYIQACLRLVGKLDEQRQGGGVPAQFVGPKLLSALNNILQLPMTDSVAMASPLVLRDIAFGGGAALELLMARTEGDIYAVNLCHSYQGRQIDGVTLSPPLFETAAARLIQRGALAP